MKNFEVLHRVFSAYGARVAVCSFAAPTNLSDDDRFFLDRMFHSLSGGFNEADNEQCLAIINKQIRELCHRDGILYVPVADNLHADLHYAVMALLNLL